MRGRWWSLVVLITVLGMDAAAQNAAPVIDSGAGDKAALQGRVDELERLVVKLQGRLDELENKTANQAPAQESATPASDDRFDALDQKLRVIERNRELEKEEADAKSKEKAFVTAGRDGFAISSGDKSFRLKVGGFVQADGKTFYGDEAHALTNSFSIRRARINFDGNLGKYIDFRFAPELGNGSVSLYDAYADLKFQPFVVLRGGKFKDPLGLEMLQADTEATFIERSLVSGLVPNRDNGFQIYGDIGGRVNYAVAVVNGAPDGTNIDGDSNDGKDVVARVFATPFTKSGPTFLKGLGFGIGTSTGRQNGSVLPAFKTSGGQATFFSYASTASAAGRRLRYSPQLYYYNGPFGIFGEYVESSQWVKGTTAHNISNHAWQVAGSWVITGEQKSYKGVTPKKGLEGRKIGDGFGAWEIAARYTELNVDPTAFVARFADITKSAQSARAWAAGLNWYLNKNARLSFDYEQTRFNGGAAIGNRPTEKALLNRLQVVF